ncbi:MAG: transglutaminase-like domain-containing protein [Treponema sp.]|nr:transglutaminase-like domain-containing protein [Treponema sp.]
MKKSVYILFFLRLFFYFSVISLLFIHPGISVSFDRIGVIQWLLIIPLLTVLAFLPEQIIKLRSRLILSLSLLVVLSLIANLSVLVFLQFLAVGFTSYALTFLLFHHPKAPGYSRMAKIAVLEPFFLAWVCLRLLAFSRSGEDIAGQSVALTQFILVWTAVVFLLHSVVIYLCIYPKSCDKVWREGGVLLLGASSALIILLVVLPVDFVRNTIIENLVSEKIPERIRSSDTDRGIPKRGNGRRTLPRGDGGQRPELRGLSEYNWSSRGGGSEDQRQYLVMVVASEKEPIYMGNMFRGQLDPEMGFIANPGEQLNNLVNQRFFVTWTNSEAESDLGREKQEVFSLSTLPQKYLPYRPVAIDPTILSDNAGPLRYIHQVVSNTHIGDPLELVNTPMRHLTDWEKIALAPYLEIPLYENDKREFLAYLNNALETWKNDRETIIGRDRYLREIFSNKRNVQNKPSEQDEQYGMDEQNEWYDGHEYDQYETDEQESGGNEYLEKIIALLVSFSEYQYNLNYDDDHSIASLKEFIVNSKEGDCVEFSNTLALLGRLAGIPSRVVTGYLAAESLQTPAHIRGLSVLRSGIPALQQFPFDKLFMVTNTHGHSWTQFYIPDYGWLDFESTAFSMPPMGMGDFNNWDVVIPLLDENRTFSQVRKFPWQAAGKAALTLIILAVICLYALRYIREIVLSFGAQKGGRAGARSLYLLLLARLAADGQPIKPASKTAHEYSQLFYTKKGSTEKNPHFKTFAEIYSELRWRDFASPEETEERFLLLKQEYHNILNSTRRRGMLHGIKRIFSLRGLAYL